MTIRLCPIPFRAVVSFFSTRVGLYMQSDWFNIPGHLVATLSSISKCIQWRFISNGGRMTTTDFPALFSSLGSLNGHVTCGFLIHLAAAFTFVMLYSASSVASYSFQTLYTNSRTHEPGHNRTLCGKGAGLLVTILGGSGRRYGPGLDQVVGIACFSALLLFFDDSRGCGKPTRGPPCVLMSCFGFCWFGLPCCVLSYSTFCLQGGLGLDWLVLR